MAQERVDTGGPALVVDVQRHPSADVALITVESVADGPRYVFTRVEATDHLILGDEVRTYGFSANDPSAESLTTPRYFQGYFQRYMKFTNPAGFRFVAGELNFAAPAGLSGAAVYRPGFLPPVIALVTDNFESATVADYDETHVSEQLVKLVEARRVVSYGIALMLGEIEDWLNDVAPPADSPPDP